VTRRRGPATPIEAKSHSESSTDRHAQVSSPGGRRAAALHHPKPAASHWQSAKPGPPVRGRHTGSDWDRATVQRRAARHSETAPQGRPGPGRAKL
jgi:hypothetical protein